MSNTKKKNRSNNRFDISEWLDNDRLSNNLPFLLFLSVLCVVYIWNIHFAEKTIRQIDKTNKELREHRWEYVTAKSALMHKRRQSQVAEMVKDLGLKPLITPPNKILIKKDGH